MVSVLPDAAMRPPKFTPAQIADIADRWRGGESQTSIARNYGTSPALIWYWTAARKISPKTVMENRRLRLSNYELKEKVRILKLQLKAASHLIASWQPSKRRRSLMVPLIRAAYDLTRPQANSIVRLGPRAGRVSTEKDKILIDLMWRYIARHPTAGFKTLFAVLKHETPAARNHALDVYQQTIPKVEERIRIKLQPKRMPPRQHMLTQESINRMWSVDFMHGKLKDGTEFWIFTGIDDFNREAIFAEAAKRRSAKFALGVIDKLRRAGRISNAIRSDNGREFRSNLYASYLKKHGIKRLHSRPYTPTDNCYVENLNKLIRNHVIERHDFKNIAQVQKQLDEWVLYYNFARPQRSLGDMSPLQFARWRLMQEPRLS